MSESLITDWSRSFHYCEDGRSLPLAWLREGWRDPPAQLGFQGPPCTAGLSGTPPHSWALGVPDGMGGDGGDTCSGRLGWRWVPVPPEQPDPRSITTQRMTINNQNKREYK